MKKELTGVAARVYPLIENAVLECGCEIWDLEFVKEGADRILRITIDTDREGGIGIEDCERVNRAVDPILDETDPIDTSYYLQVSSPGIERELKNEEHIAACEGWDVEVRLYAPKDGSKLFRGVLLPLEEDGMIRIDAAGTVLSFEPSAVAKLCTYFEF